MIELRWRKAEGLTHVHSAPNGFGPATAVTATSEQHAVMSARGEWMVLQYKWTVVPGETGPVVPMSSEWEDVPDPASTT
jgi:hypothetical protein